MKTSPHALAAWRWRYLRKIRWANWRWGLALPLGLLAQTLEPPSVPPGFGKPAVITTADLAQFAALPADRRKLLEGALAVARDSAWLPYTTRGSDPADGGFDCSGAMYFVLRRAGLDPPRMATAQFQWLQRHARLHRVPVAAALTLSHPSLRHLHPGDLLFWGKPGSLEPALPAVITHVALFLGPELTDQRPVMINSTDGRSYRGIKANGYGVYDFRLPIAGARIAFLGYGTPPGIATMDDHTLPGALDRAPAILPQ